jgi:SAM-dependent methyltransferase
VKQNKYDDPGFFETYSRMPRSVHGLSEAGEWYALRSLLPELRGKRLLDLGCGFGWHCRYAREQQARSALGVDISERMLTRARESTDDAAIQYMQSAIEDLDFDQDVFDIVLSSLALHYLDRFDLVCQRVCRWLTPGGVFVFSVEHPVFTAVAAQQWCYGPDGSRLHWPVDDYFRQGARHTQWLAEDVVKYHRTITTYINTLIDAGFRILNVSEAEPLLDIPRDRQDWRDEQRRPMFLLIGAAKPDS